MDVGTFLSIHGHTISKAVENVGEGLRDLGKAALTIAEVNQKTLPMLERMERMMAKLEPLADHAIKCMKKEIEEETKPSE